MKRLLVITLLLVFVLAVPSFAQWQFVKAFPDTSYKQQVHAIATDPDGNIWIGMFDKSDSISNGVSMIQTRKIDVFKPDGTRKFPPIKTITIGGKTDTLYVNTMRGARTASDGNILWAYGDILYKIDYKTGNGLLKGARGDGNSLAAPACDSLGEVFTALVLEGTGPINIYSLTDFSTPIGTVVDTSRGFSRSFEVSANGDDVYWAGYTNAAIWRYHSDNGSFGPYVLKDTIAKGAHAESMTWNKKDGYLYFSSGSYNDPPDSASGMKKSTWYAFNPKTNSVVLSDSMPWNQTVSPGDCRPRGLAFSVGGDTAYACEFGLSGVPSVQMFVRIKTSVEPINNLVPESYDLKQNYPNPFNPSTEIEFSLPKAGSTTLKVYDLLGQEVASLLSENLAPGSYKVKFDGSRLASGTYIYRITSGSTTITKKMMLLK